MSDTPTTTALPRCGNAGCELPECQPPAFAPETPLETPPAPPALTSVTTRDGASGAGAGVAFLNSAASAYDWRDMPPATVSDILAAIRERVAVDWEAGRNLARTMRAYGREQTGEMRQFGPRFREMIAGGELLHPTWFETPETPYAWPVDPLDMIGRATDAGRVLVCRTAPESPTALAYGATVRDMVAAWCEVRDILTNDCEALAEALAEAATDNGWCPVYDRLVSDLNGWCPSHVGEPFRRSEPLQTVWEASGTLTVTIPIGGTFYATADDDHGDLAGDALASSADDMLSEVRRALGRYVNVDWEVETDDYTDTGERAD